MSLGTLGKDDDFRSAFKKELAIAKALLIAGWTLVGLITYWGLYG